MNENNYNYVEGYFLCSNVGSKYNPFGANASENAKWSVEFESVKMSHSGKLAEHLDSNSDGWRVSVNSDHHPVVYWSKDSSHRGSYTFDSLTVPWDTWTYIRFRVQISVTNPTIRCYVGSMTQDVQVQGRWNTNTDCNLQIGGNYTTIRGTVTVKGYPYNSDILGTATFDMDSLSVGATTATVNGDTYTISSAVRNSAGVRVKYNGEWKNGTLYAKVNGEWKYGQVYAKVNGTWKEGT